MKGKLPPYPKEIVRELAKSWDTSGSVQEQHLWRFLRVAKWIYEGKKTQPRSRAAARRVWRRLQSILMGADSLRTIIRPSLHKGSARIPLAIDR